MKIGIKDDDRVDFMSFLTNAIMMKVFINRIDGDSKRLQNLKIKIEGVYKAYSLNNLHTFRSTVINDFRDKVLYIYLNKEAKRFYKCVFNDDFNFIFNDKLISIFDFSFDTIFPYSFEKEITNYFCFAEENIEDDINKYILTNKGSAPVYPNIDIKTWNDCKIFKTEAPLFSINDIDIHVKKNFFLKYSDSLKFIDGVLLLNGEQNYNYFYEDELLNSIKLQPGDNTFFINKNAINVIKEYKRYDKDIEVYFKYEPAYYSTIPIKEFKIWESYLSLLPKGQNDF